MALENYQEMRDAVRSPQFLRRQELAAALERQFPGRFIPRYSMVMFHPEIPYSQAHSRGGAQQRVLDTLLASGDTIAPDLASRAHIEALLDQSGL
jgi:kynurenine 3-monooxygenase